MINGVRRNIPFLTDTPRVMLFIDIKMKERDTQRRQTDRVVVVL